MDGWNGKKRAAEVERGAITLAFSERSLHAHTPTPTPHPPLTQPWRTLALTARPAPRRPSPTRTWMERWRERERGRANGVRSRERCPPPLSHTRTRRASAPPPRPPCVSGVSCGARAAGRAGPRAWREGAAPCCCCRRRGCVLRSIQRAHARVSLAPHARPPLHPPPRRASGGRGPGLGAHGPHPPSGLWAGV